jgi:hypothetical protein
MSTEEELKNRHYYNFLYAGACIVVAFLTKFLTPSSIPKNDLFELNIAIFVLVLGFHFFMGRFFYQRMFKKKKTMVSGKSVSPVHNPLSGMNLSELDKRAYAELVSENYSLSLGFLNELIDNRGRELFKFYNMRAECFMMLNDPLSALKDSIRSVELEADINVNKKGYEIRNLLTKNM